MLVCTVHNRLFASHLSRWFDVRADILASFAGMVEVTESVCDACEETQKNCPFLIDPEFYLQENRMPY
jgi:hypothetical protein